MAAIIVGGIFPTLIQRFQVQPNELALETPYIEYNIEFTREAFALNRIEEQSFPAEDTPSPQDIAQNETTINNIRLWDHRCCHLRRAYSASALLPPCKALTGNSPSGAGWLGV